jgi:hypothetical protein
MKIVCETYSRVSGYYRPVNQWNPAKREEFKERKCAAISDVIYSASSRDFSKVLYKGICEK